MYCPNELCPVVTPKSGLCEGVKKIISHDGLETIVDCDDYAKLSSYKWSLDSTNTFITSFTKDSKRFVVRIYQMIYSAPKGMVIDHINGNRLDNRKQNLRIITKQQNCFNRVGYKKPTSSIFKGVYNNGSSWIANIHHNHKTHYLGSYKKESEAAIAYNNAATLRFGDFAKLNPV